MIKTKHITFTKQLVLILLLSGVPSAIAEPAASEWISSKYGQVRLISGVTAVGASGTIPMGIQIRLMPEWKTYWRSPGDSGIPPRFNWSESENLKSADVSYPAPSRYASFGLETIGYKDHVIFPVTAHIDKLRQQVNVRLTLDYAVCRDICVPLQADLSLSIRKGSSVETDHAQNLDVFGDLVPTTDGSSGVSLKMLRQTKTDDVDNLYASFSGVSKQNNYDLFVEAGDDFGFESPIASTRRSSDEIEFTIPVHQYRKSAKLSSTPIVLTLIAGSLAIELPGKLSAD